MAIKFREKVLNAKGLKPILIEMHDGKLLDFNMLSGPQKRKLKKSLLNQMPKIWRHIEMLKRVKFYDKPLKENVYFCDKCNMTHVAHDLDKGGTPVYISCHNCNNPQARSLLYQITDTYKDKKPNILFRYPSEAEYLAADDALKEHLEKGGLYMEIIK